jgi:hypothetical protein
VPGSTQKTEPEIEFERMGYLSVVAMSKQGARDFFGMPDARVEYDRQADPKKYRFGACVFRVYPRGD